MSFLIEEIQYTPSRRETERLKKENPDCYAKIIKRFSSNDVAVNYKTAERYKIQVLFVLLPRVYITIERAFENKKKFRELVSSCTLQISYFDCWKVPYLVIPQYNKLSIYTQGVRTIPYVTRN